MGIISRALRGLLKRVTPLGILVVFVCRVLHGYRVYKELYQQRRRNIYAHYASSGDVYVSCGMLRSYLKKNGRSEDYVLAVRGAASASVARLLGIDNTAQLNTRQSYNLVNFFCFSPKGLPRMEFLYYLTTHTTIAMRTIGLHGVFLYEQNLHCVFPGLTAGDFELPRFAEEHHSFADRIFRELELKPGKTALLSPYAYSLSIDGQGFWETLAARLRERGYSVCTNVGNDREKPVPGTEAVSIPHEQLKNFLERAGMFIGLRSGLCDVISTIKCKKIILYPDKVWPFGKGDAMRDVFSIKQLPHCEEASEIVYAGEQETLSKIVELLA